MPNINFFRKIKTTNIQTSSKAFSALRKFPNVSLMQTEPISRYDVLNGNSKEFQISVEMKSLCDIAIYRILFVNNET